MKFAELDAAAGVAAAAEAKGRRRPWRRRQVRRLLGLAVRLHWLAVPAMVYYELQSSTHTCTHAAVKRSAFSLRPALSLTRCMQLEGIAPLSAPQPTCSLAGAAACAARSLTACAIEHRTPVDPL